jgi:hypothetical protein
MTITPIHAAAAAYLAGTENVATIVYGAPHPELSRLLAIQAERGSISTKDYDEASRVLGKSKRQIQRMLASLRQGTRPAGRRAFELTERHEQVIMACHGNVALAYRELLKAGEELPGLKTFWRAWFSEPTGKQAFARKGAQGLVECWVYPPWEAPERNAVCGRPTTSSFRSTSSPTVAGRRRSSPGSPSSRTTVRAR